MSTAAAGITTAMACALIVAGCAGQSQTPDIPPSGLWSASIKPASVSSNQTQPWSVATRRSTTDRAGSSSRPPQALPKGGGHYKVGRPYQIKGKWYTPKVDKTYDRTGMASWYGPGFHTKQTANGEIFDENALTAAHPTLPLPSFAYVTNLENGRTLLVRINDRGPYKGNRILDASKRVARELGFEQQGVARVRVRYAGRAPLDGDDARERTHLASVQGR